MILVTGTNGFIGKNLSQRLKNIEAIEKINCFKKLKHISWDKISCIYHLGAISNTTESDIKLIYRYNIDYTLMLFKYAIKYQIPVVYASSASVYGNSHDYQINPLNYYAMSKATIDLWVNDNIENFKNIIGLRYFNVYGDDEDQKGNQASPIYQFTKQAKLTGKIKVFEGSENYIRDFICINDVIDCTLETRLSGIYDVGTSMPISFKKVAEIIAKKYDANIEIIPFPNELKNKYQKYTIARKHYNKKFITVEEWINGKI